MNDVPAADAVMRDLVLGHRVQDFLAREAELLDAGRFADWLNLFAPDGVYWLPSSADQTDRHGQVSIICEDKALLGVRVARLAHPAAHALEPQPTTVHLVGNVRLQAVPSDLAEPLVVHSALVVTENRDDRQTLWSGQVTHHLSRVADDLQIVLKRVDLAQCGGAMPMIGVPL